jgi:hypothetical protein
MSTILKRHLREILLQGIPLRSDGSRNNQTGGWILEEAAKGTQSYANSRGTIKLSPLRSDGSRDGQAGGWILWEVAKDTQVRVKKQLYWSKGPSQKIGIVIAKRKFNLLFLGVRRSGEMKLKM